MLRVAVVFGGRSSEHSISCISAGSILRALDRSAYDVVPLGVARDGRWFRQADDADRLRLVDGVLPSVDLSGPECDPWVELGSVDVVFPVLHGPFGEDGTIQGMLEVVGTPYVGSGVLASAASMDKSTTKSLLRDAGLDVGSFVAFGDRQWPDDRERILADIAALGFPVFVKPSRAGSSLGIAKVHGADDLEVAIDKARDHDPRIIVEASIESAREIECGVLVDDQGRPHASSCAEIRVREGHEFYDFEAKYLDDSADLILPADLPDDIVARVQRDSLRVFDVMGCEGLARVDFFVAGDRVMVNELNTMPGFTSISMFPRMWGHAGVTYPDLVGRLIRDAMRRGTGLR